MDFILNADCAETKSWRPYDPEDGFNGLSRDLMLAAEPASAHSYPRTEMINMLREPSLQGVENVHSGYLYVLSDSYSLHKKVVLAPHDIWYIVLAEVAAIVGRNVNACRPMFTKSPDKIQILVPTDDVTTIDLNKVEQELRALVPLDLDTFLPDFSTMTADARYACLAAFCESASNYYEYGTFCCGIPAIRIEGDVAEWALLQKHASLLAMEFDKVGLNFIAPWMSRVCVAVDNIIHALSTGSPDRLQTIFTQSRIGSGGQQKVDGWFADIYSKPLRGRQMEGFPASLSVVPYFNVETGRRFKGIHGCLMTKRTDDGFIYGAYGEIVTETVPYVAPPMKVRSFEVPAQ